jgi:hypothetical protein
MFYGTVSATVEVTLPKIGMRCQTGPRKISGIDS